MLSIHLSPLRCMGNMQDVRAESCKQHLHFSRRRQQGYHACCSCCCCRRLQPQQQQQQQKLLHDVLQAPRNKTPSLFQQQQLLHFCLCCSAITNSGTDTLTANKSKQKASRNIEKRMHAYYMHACMHIYHTNIHTNGHLCMHACMHAFMHACMQK